jgi:hypothetical protein
LESYKSLKLMRFLTRHVLFNTIVSLMRVFWVIVLAGVAGLVVGGVSSYLVVRIVVLIVGPIFWEGGEAFLPMFATFLGGIAGGISAAVCVLPVVTRASLKKSWLGACLGISLGLGYGLWLVSHGTFTDSRAPKGIAFWTVVVLVIAAGLAGMIGALFAESGGLVAMFRRLFADKSKWRFSVRTLILFVTLIAVLLGLMMMLR